jgi:hypothetical protein
MKNLPIPSTVALSPETGQASKGKFKTRRLDTLLLLVGGGEKNVEPVYE